MSGSRTVVTRMRKMKNNRRRNRLKLIAMKRKRTVRMKSWKGSMAETRTEITRLILKRARKTPMKLKRQRKQRLNSPLKLKDRQQKPL